MTADRVFVDTNVLVYSHNADEPAKQAVAKERIADLWQEVRGVISTQVLQELFVTVKGRFPGRWTVLPPGPFFRSIGRGSRV
jgi:predicted nucleic acid-binding protein